MISQIRTAAQHFTVHPEYAKMSVKELKALSKSAAQAESYSRVTAAHHEISAGPRGSREAASLMSAADDQRAFREELDKLIDSRSTFLQKHGRVMKKTALWTAVASGIVSLPILIALFLRRPDPSTEAAALTMGSPYMNGPYANMGMPR